MECKDTKETVCEKRDFVAKQTTEAMTTGFVTLRNCGEIRTRTIPVWSAFRCLYCGEYFNQKMGEEHFGMSRKEFFEAPAVEDAIAPQGVPKGVPRSGTHEIQTKTQHPDTQ